MPFRKRSRLELTMSVTSALAAIESKRAGARNRVVGVDEAVLTALIAGTSALFGTAVGAGSTVAIEIFRARNAHRDKARDREFQAVVDLFTTTREWIASVSKAVGADPNDHEAQERVKSELFVRAEAMRKAITVLRIVSSDQVVVWLDEDLAENISNVLAIAEPGTPLPSSVADAFSQCMTRGFDLCRQQLKAAGLTLHE
jgi:hypothetical protein